MKRFLILSILMAFATVSCAGPNKTGWTKRDFRQDKFEKDREECIQTLNNNLRLYSQTSGVFGYCMFKKGYEYQPQSEFPFDKKDTPAKTVVKVLLGIVLIPPLIVLANDTKGIQEILFAFDNW